MPKIIEIGYFLTEIFKKIKGGRFFLGRGVHCVLIIIVILFAQ